MGVDKDLTAFINTRKAHTGQDRKLHCGGGCQQNSELWRRLLGEHLHGKAVAVDPHYSDIFGEDFIKNVIIVATHWGYNEQARHVRKENAKNQDFTDWLSHQKKISKFDKLKYGNQLEAIYFTPWNLVHDPSLRHNSYDNLIKLYEWSLKRKP